ncbi:hypothetical protein J2125_002776 [Erwinia toletana]|uniref:Serine kinase n=1 Tax=Winslowiella toletana TaxID=92490 RepID=A0ABS4PAC5_9GAMM|nr:hypothetical protein [Winslowiella toletana]MBP2169584.1 hypothetical protein [Winslowiella toletana]
MNDDELNLSWLSWWQRGFWLQADRSWHNSRFATLSDEQQQRFLQQHAVVLQQSLAIPPTPVTPPQPLVLAISALTPQGRQLLLDLVAEICGCATPLPSEMKIWCRRLAKGLRPASWLPPALFASGQAADSLQLLHALWPAGWPRLQLLFPQPAVSRSTPPPAIAAGRLQPLWQAALWQCQRHDLIDHQPGDSYVES